MVDLAGLGNASAHIDNEDCRLLAETKPLAETDIVVVVLLALDVRHNRLPLFGSLGCRHVFRTDPAF